MSRYVAFLRGVNLGSRRLKMDELRRHFEPLEVDNPSTYLASGNVIFDHGRTVGGGLEQRIEAHLADALGYEVDTFLRPLDSLGDVVRRAEAEKASWVADADTDDDDATAGSRIVDSKTEELRTARSQTDESQMAGSRPEESRRGTSQAVKPHVIFLPGPVDSSV